jgi:FKBP-type peptidyl-prolyl cis-trans isomerase
MNKVVMAGALAVTVALTACNKKEEAAAPAEVKLDSNIQKVSYGIGLNISSNFKKQGVDIDMDAFKKGLADGASDAEPMLNEQELMQAMQTFQQEQMEKQMKEREALVAANKAEGEKYLAENGQKEGVVTTESGLQYSVVTKVEEGASPTAEDTVVVHYRGTLINGEEFDSSYSRNQPATFGVGQVIPGWTEVLQLMKVGEKFSVVIPSNLAYGESGAGAKIGPNATLLFEVELLEIVGKEAPAVEETPAAEAAPAAEAPAEQAAE